MKRKKIIIIAAAAALLLAAGAAVYFFFFRNGEESEKGREKPEEYYEYAIKNSFVTNVKESSKLFKTTIVLVADEEGLDEFFEAKQSTVRDVILFMLRELTEEDIESADIQESLRVSIPAALNEALGVENITSIYFTDFVMQ